MSLFCCKSLMAKTSAEWMPEEQGHLCSEWAHLIQLSLCRHRAPLPEVHLGAKRSPEAEENTNAHSSRPSLKGRTHSDYSLRQGVRSQAHRAGQKAVLGLRVARFEVGFFDFSMVLAHGSGLWY